MLATTRRTSSCNCKRGVGPAAGHDSPSVQDTVTHNAAGDPGLGTRLILCAAAACAFTVFVTQPHGPPLKKPGSRLVMPLAGTGMPAVYRDCASLATSQAAKTPTMNFGRLGTSHRAAKEMTVVRTEQVGHSFNPLSGSGSRCSESPQVQVPVFAQCQLPVPVVSAMVQSGRNQCEGPSSSAPWY